MKDAINKTRLFLTQINTYHRAFLQENGGIYLVTFAFIAQWRLACLPT